MSVDEAQTGKRLRRYYWSAFVIAGMMVGFLGCLVYSHLNKGRLNFPDAAVAGNPKAVDKPIIKAAMAVEAPSAPSAFLGVEVISVNAVIAGQLDLPNVCGVLVNSVVDNSPAQKAGLKRGDVILSLNNIAVKDLDGLRAVMAQLDAGDEVKIIYIRDGQKDVARATLSNLAAARAAVEYAEDTGWGVSLSVLSSSLRTALRIPANIDGVVLTSVKPGGLADQAGLQSGDVITGVDNKAIANMSDFLKVIAAADDNIVLLDIYSKGQQRFVALDSSAVAAAARQRQTSLLDRVISIFTDDDNVILTEHINEESDYEKPVCKRLEESGERYEDKD